MVKWTAHAKALLRYIHDYIAEDSPFYAKRVAEALVQRTVDLDQLPRKGKVVSELNEENIRERSLYSYRPRARSVDSHYLESVDTILAHTAEPQTAAISGCL